MASAGDSGTASSKRSSKSVEAPAEDLPALDVADAPVLPAPSDTTYKGLAPEEWARVAWSFDTTPQMIMGALDPGNTYMRDAVAQMVAAFLAAPAEKE